jgi:hypothetical protein
MENRFTYDCGELAEFSTGISYPDYSGSETAKEN